MNLVKINKLHNKMHNNPNSKNKYSKRPLKMFNLIQFNTIKIQLKPIMLMKDILKLIQLLNQQSLPSNL
jgi:hypothetical protein